MAKRKLAEAWKNPVLYVVQVEMYVWGETAKDAVRLLNQLLDGAGDVDNFVVGDAEPA